MKENIEANKEKGILSKLWQHSWIALLFQRN
jgi:hypothetical protein